MLLSWNLRSSVVFGLSLGVAGCGSVGAVETKVVDRPTPVGDAGATEGGEPLPCGATIQNQPLLDSPHIPACSPVAYANNPPTSGPHYPDWASFGEYDFAIPRGYWV